MKCHLKSPHVLADFDTSCFSGKYVTGHEIGDEYFTKLSGLRNDDAKQKRNSSVISLPSTSSLPVQSNDGCESVSNDKRGGNNPDDGCESLSNNMNER